LVVDDVFLVVMFSRFFRGLMVVFNQSDR